jgi:membrane-bound lytic murein transglycosylase B
MTAHMHMRAHSLAGIGRIAAISAIIVGVGVGSAWLAGAETAEPVSLSANVAPPSPPTTSTRPDVTEDVQARLVGFIAALRPDAERRGVSREVFDRAVAGLEPDTEIFALLESQPEHVSAPWDYINRLVSETRIDNGVRLLAQHAETLAAIEKRWGVDRHVVVAIWGVESSFGAAPGARSVIRSLATLAVGDKGRPQFWRAELLVALTILQSGEITPERMTGSWAGAMGHTQFMPSSWVAHAADFDGDGKRNIWGSAPDALASTANYLKNAGWTAGETWGAEVVLPTGFDYALSAPGIAKPPAEWKQLGIDRPSGRPWPALGSASLVLPAGARGPAFLVGANFRAILKYNNALSYALAVGHLADRLAGAPPIASPWPTDDPPLARAARIELQQRLAGLGFEVGTPDGVVGTQTRAAVRAWQKKNGLIEDGWAGERLLEKVRHFNKPAE